MSSCSDIRGGTHEKNYRRSFGRRRWMASLPSTFSTPPPGRYAISYRFISPLPSPLLPFPLPPVLSPFPSPSSPISPLPIPPPNNPPVDTIRSPHPNVSPREDPTTPALHGGVSTSRQHRSSLPFEGCRLAIEVKLT